MRPEVTNHLELVQGGAPFALGEATAIALATTLFPEQLTQLNLLRSHAAITYHRLALGGLTGRAKLSIEECEQIRRVFDERGRVRFPVKVSLTDTPGAFEPKGGAVTTLSVECVVRHRTNGSRA